MQNSYKFMCLLVSAVTLSTWICACYLTNTLSNSTSVMNYLFEVNGSWHVKCAPWEVNSCLSSLTFLLWASKALLSSSVFIQRLHPLISFVFFCVVLFNFSMFFSSTYCLLSSVRPSGTAYSVKPFNPRSKSYKKWPLSCSSFSRQDLAVSFAQHSSYWNKRKHRKVADPTSQQTRIESMDLPQRQEYMRTLNLVLI